MINYVKFKHDKEGNRVRIKRNKMEYKHRTYNSI